MSTAVVAKIEPKRSLLAAMADGYGMDTKAFEMTIRRMAMPDKHSEEEFAACCLVAHQHGLNPITREIYFMRAKAGQVQPIVGVDGWIRKCNEHPAFDGMDFEDIHDAKGELHAIKCIIHRKDRTNPIVVTEYLSECKRGTDNWRQMPHRMLRHRALIQCARVGFGFAGIMDQDEFDAWQESYRSEHAKDDFTPIKFAPPPVPPAIPDLAKELATEQPQASEPTVDQPAKEPGVSDEKFLSSLDDAYAGAIDLDALNEVLVHNETAIDERGLQQAAGDIYQRHKVRIYDAMT